MTEQTPGEIPNNTAPAERPESPQTAAELSAQIADLQKQLKAVNRESAERRKALEVFEKAEEARKTAEMTEAERLKSELEKIKQEKLAAESLARDAMIRAAVNSKAAGRFFDPDDVYSALKDKLILGPAGEIDNLDDELKTLAAAKPHWVKPVGANVRPTSPAGGQPGNGESYSDKRKRLIG